MISQSSSAASPRRDGLELIQVPFVDFRSMMRHRPSSVQRMLAWVPDTLPSLMMRSQSSFRPILMESRSAIDACETREVQKQGIASIASPSRLWRILCRYLRSAGLFSGQVSFAAVVVMSEVTEEADAVPHLRFTPALPM